VNKTFDLLEGRLRLHHSRHNPSEDALWLAAAVAPTPGQHVLDAGCGSGIIGLALHTRCPDLHLTLLDMDAAAIRSAQANANLNGCSPTLVQGCFEALPFRPRTFDHVVANLPFHASVRGHTSTHKARAHTLPADKLPAWLAALWDVSGQTLTVLIHMAEKETARTFATTHSLHLRCLPLRSRAGKPAKRLISQFSQAPLAPDMVINTFEPAHRHRTLHRGETL
jgi:tRNA1(Val) A37 N6-methylase TrmN6